LHDSKLDYATTSKFVEWFVVGDKKDGINTNNILAFKLLNTLHDIFENIK
jgi:hypothetical protein